MDKPVSRTGLIALVRRLIEVDYSPEDEGDQLYDHLRRHVIDPEVRYSLAYRDLSPEEVIDRALAHQSRGAGYSPY